MISMRSAIATLVLLAILGDLTILAQPDAASPDAASLTAGTAVIYVMLAIMVLGAIGGTVLLTLGLQFAYALRYIALLIGVPLCGLLTYEGILPVYIGGPAIVAVVGFAIGRDILSDRRQ